MILIGQYDSSFVRRVAIAMRLYGIQFEHRPWSVFRDAEKLREINPLGRVPTLILDSGEVLIESHSIIDYLDGLVEPARRLFPQKQPERLQAMKIVSLATGLSDRGVSLFYELNLHEKPSPELVKRLTGQMLQTLSELETARAAGRGTYLFEGRITHADIALAAVLRHQSEGHPQLVKLAGHPALAGHCAAMEALPVFKEIFQPFIAPK